RQLDRLAEEGISVVKVPALPAATLAQRLAQTADGRTAAVLVSAVLYGNAHIVPRLGQVLDACQQVGAELLVDAYHALNVVPFSPARSTPSTQTHASSRETGVSRYPSSGGSSRSGHLGRPSCLVACGSGMSGPTIERTCCDLVPPRICRMRSSGTRCTRWEA